MSLRVYLERALSPEDRRTYETLFTLGPEWKHYSIFLSRGNEYPINGICCYVGSIEEVQTPAEHDLGAGGYLEKLVFFASPNAEIEIIPETLGPEILPPSEKVQEVLDHMNETPLVHPFRFAETGKRDAILLAENGKAFFEISAQSGTEFAAQELQRVLNQATGADFPISSEKKLPQIRLEVFPQSGPDSFQCTGNSDGIVIRGNSRQALLFGVYSFLEKAVGARWYSPRPYGEVIPRLSRLSLPEFSDESTARIPLRKMHYCCPFSSDLPDLKEHVACVADWAVKNRFNTVLERFNAPSDFYSKRGNFLRLTAIPSHNYHMLIPPSVYGESHPEYYAFNQAAGKYQVENSQLCVTNCDVIRIIAEKAREFFRNNPEEPCFPLMQEDGYSLWCQCPECEAVMPTSGGIYSGSTDRNVYLANQVMELIRDEFPDKGIIIFAYSFSVEPPKKVIPAPGVEIMFCFYSDDRAHLRPWESDTVAEYYLRWQEYPDVKLWFYSYHYLFQSLRMSTPDALTGSFRFFETVGMKGSSQESSVSWGTPDAYLIYLGARLGWDPFQDEAVLRKDYFEGLYGAAGAEVQRAYELICDALISRSGKLLYVCWAFFPAISDERIAEIEACYERAAQAVENDPRAMEALKDVRLYFKNLVLTVYAARRIDSYFRSPSPEAYHAAIAALDELDQSCLPLYEQYLLGSRTMMPHWRDGINSDFQRKFPDYAQPDLEHDDE